MKSKFLFFVPGLLLLACNGSPAANQNNVQTKSTANASAEVVSVDTEASSSLFLDDMVDSAMTQVDDGKVEDSVKDDMKADRLKAVAERMLTQLDKDGNKALSEAEFLAIQGQAGGKCKALSAEKLAEVQAKFKAEFVAAAGADASLSLEEIQVALKAQAIRIGKFREQEHKGGQVERIKQTFEDILAKYDKDGDKKLSKEEFGLMRADLMKMGQGDDDGKGKCPHDRGHEYGRGEDDSKDKDKPKDDSKDKDKPEDDSKNKDKPKDDSKAPAGDGSIIVIPKPA